jgi:hypothetical protein
MTFDEFLAQIRELLQRKQRLSCRALEVGNSLGQDEECPGHRSLITAYACQDRYCKPYISLPAIGMRAVRISPDNASVM